MNRQDKILQRAQTSGRVLVEDLALTLEVSQHTIRRDINALCAEGKLRRLHGGAEFIDANLNLPYAARSTLNAAAKKRIALEAARLIPDNATLFFSIGTTPAFVASALSDHQGLHVITNNLNVALAVAEAPGVRIILPGGDLRLPDRDFLGPQVLETVRAYRADFAIFGVGGIDTDGSLLDFHEDEAQARRAMQDNARASILVADQSKFGRRAAAIGGKLTDMDHIVLDAAPSAEFHTLLDPITDRVAYARDTA
ncbi:DeoR/GlpR transcriptional regulator [Shimia sp. R11_0]|uniref:DeoR/GlpR family DNA-binding transcription regulator n=1 Tax=Shimia sp. R11_0 TaxID=2821096 RepID=UPI001ADD28D8|nr:DeoR/GlpR family DNA-binding transcription regulator [Shimia sp. R11_0]MBO9477905.1 DeoR/GlpR transcriptional regulator [Shimia sp. R11_0]